MTRLNGMALFFRSLYATVLACAAGTALALPISPADVGLIVATGTSTSQPNLSTIQTLTGVPDLYEAYKKDAPSTESGSHPYAGSYTATFNGDLSGGTIVWDSPAAAIASSDVYMLVKDGNHEPTWYLFDLSTVWDGMETITLSGFWPAQGSISNIVIYAGQTTSVPDGGTTVLLIGAGLLLVLIAVSWRRLRST